MSACVCERERERPTCRLHRERVTYLQVVCVGVHGCAWVCVGVRGCAACVCMGVHGCAWVCMGVHGCAWVCMGVLGCVWVCMGVLGCAWVCMDVHAVCEWRLCRTFLLRRPNSQNRAFAHSFSGFILSMRDLRVVRLASRLRFRRSLARLLIRLFGRDRLLQGLRSLQRFHFFFKDTVPFFYQPYPVIFKVGIILDLNLWILL